MTHYIKQDKTWVKDKIDIIFNHGKEEILIIKDAFERDYKEIISIIPYEVVLNSMSKSVIDEFNMVKINKENIKKYLEDKLKENILLDKRLADEKIKNNEIIKLKKNFENIYLELYQHERLNKDIEYKERIIKDFNEQNRDEYIKQSKKYNVPTINEAREQLLERIEELKVEIESPNRKKMWDNALKTGKIQYISFDGTKMGVNDKKEKENICTFTPNNVSIIKRYKLFLDTLKVDGYLVKVKVLTTRTTNFVTAYFNEIEELKTLDEYIIDEIDAIIELDNKANKTRKIESDLEPLIEKRNSISIDIESKKENIKKSNIYINYKTELQIDEWENNHEFYGNAIKKLSLKIYNNEKKNIIDGNVNIVEEKTLLLIQEFYEGKINEMCVLFDSFKRKVVKKADVFQSLYYLKQQIQNRDINTNINAILDNNLDTVDLEILDGVVEKSINEIEEITELKERNTRSSFVARYNTIEAMKNIKRIQLAPRVSLSEDIYGELQMEIAKEKIRDIFRNYIRVNGLLEIKRREDDFYEEFKKIKGELFKTTDISFKNFLEIKTENQEQVKLNV